MNVTGLTHEEAEQQLLRYGPNELVMSTRFQAARLLLSQFSSPIVIILLFAIVISALSGEVRDSIIILAILIPSGLLGFYQEYRASNTMKALLDRVQVKCRVVRSNEVIELSTRDIVVGDVVVLRAGDIIPADLEVISSQRLQADESALTGEVYPVEKSTNATLYFGTSIVSGSGYAKVTSVGGNTKYGKLVQNINQAEVVTNFERGTRQYGIMLMWAMLTLIAVLVLARIVLERPLLESLLFAFALAVGLTPEMLPVIVSVSLAAGARAMAKRGVIVKRLDAIEDFGAMTALCTDKTGTITEGKVRLIQTLNLSDKEDSAIAKAATFNAKLQQGFINPLDDAVLAYGCEIDESITALAEIPYTFETRRITIKLSTGQVITKGAFAEIAAQCLGVPQSARTQYEKYTSQGHRVLALATKEEEISSDIDESGFELRGFLIFSDPPKVDAQETLLTLAQQGVEVFMITGDSPLTARALAQEVGIDAQEWITGDDFATMSESDLAQKVQTCRIFASVDPIQKHSIIKLLQANGHTVGYFGDGINDAAALRAADVGISVDTAVDIAKSSAAIVLLTKDLNVIVEGIRLGRRTFVNTLKYIKVTLSANFGNMLSMAASSFFLPFLPLLPSQILLLNFMSDFPDLAIATDNVDAKEVEKPRTWDIKDIRNFMLTFGLVSTFFDFLVFGILLLGFDVSADEFRTAWFVESTLTELAAMLVLRSALPFWKSRPSTALLSSTIALAVVVLLLPYFAFSSVISLVSLSLPLLLTLVGVIVAYVVANEVTKVRYFKTTLS